MELHNPMMCSRLPLFTHVVRPVQRRLKTKANNPVCPALKSEKKPFVDEVNKGTLEVACTQNIEPPLKKNKLDPKEIKPSSDVCLKSSPATVKTEAIYPDVFKYLYSNVTKYPITQTSPEGLPNTVDNEQKLLTTKNMAAKKIFMRTEAEKTEAHRKADETTVINKTPEVENLLSQPNKSNAKMMKDVEMSQPEEAVNHQLISDSRRLKIY
ncbi:hypothetical protein PYW08_009835 [Mythimna loreyi]|uniref:Uncharacterized protein n=1 Tax=Mythimna loreyi TaxID=667449 RepID=A0ACC2Q8W0_9NEOP|nr:hypothetical protein PYW08_009835 [Mythimna loreyi]